MHCSSLFESLSPFCLEHQVQNPTKGSCPDCIGDVFTASKLGTVAIRDCSFLCPMLNDKMCGAAHSYVGNTCISTSQLCPLIVHCIAAITI
jgi:hypothetical protein